MHSALGDVTWGSFADFVWKKLWSRERWNLVHWKYSALISPGGVLSVKIHDCIGALVGQLLQFVADFRCLQHHSCYHMVSLMFASVNQKHFRLLALLKANTFTNVLLRR